MIVQRTVVRLGARGIKTKKRVVCGRGVSIVVLWPKLCASNAGGLGSIPGQGTSSYMLLLKDSACHKED